LGQNLAQILKKRGVKLHLNSMVKNVEETAEGTTVNFVTKDVEGSATGEVVLCAIGRKPYLDGLFTDECKPEMNGKSIKVELRLLPNHPMEANAQLRVAVDMGGEPQVREYQTKGRSETWKQNILRNQAVVTVEFPASATAHPRLNIKALDKGVVLDQVLVYSK
jgi:phytoene dehydrogenase-like protein